MTWDTYLVDGVDLARPDRIVETFESPAAAWQGSNYNVPGRSGSIWSAKARDDLTIPVGVTVTCADPVTGVDPVALDDKVAQFNQNWADLVKLVKPRRRRPVLSKRLSLPSGVQHTVAAQFEVAGGLAQSRLGPHTARTVINFELGEGCWLDENISSYDLVSGTNHIPVSGSTDTDAIVVDLEVTVAGTQTLTNVSTGVAFSYVWTADRVGTVVTVDAQDFTVTRDTGSVVVASLSSFSHTGDARFMVLDPDAGGGTNELSLSMGTAKLSYRGAWL